MQLHFCVHMCIFNLLLNTALNCIIHPEDGTLYSVPQHVANQLSLVEFFIC